MSAASDEADSPQLEGMQGALASVPALHRTRLVANPPPGEAASETGPAQANEEAGKADKNTCMRGHCAREGSVEV